MKKWIHSSGFIFYCILCLFGSFLIPFCYSVVSEASLCSNEIVETEAQAHMPVRSLSVSRFQSRDHTKSQKKSKNNKNDKIIENKNRHKRNQNDQNNQNKNNKNNKNNKKEDSKEKEEKPPTEGNFALPAAQQPAALVSFGFNIFDKGTLQLNAFGDNFKGRDKDYSDVIPFVIYCPTDSSSFLFAVPYAPRYQEDGYHSSGLEDMVFQYEYAYATINKANYQDQFTIVLNMTFPTGSATKDPATGFGAPSFFIGTTLSRTFVDWLFFTSYGVVLPSRYHGTQFGSQFLYQAGFGRNIAYLKDKWIFDWMVEVTGLYANKNRIKSITDPDSGGNVILVTPSLWFSTKHIILQLGIGAPISQYLFGVQRKTDYAVFWRLAWTF